MKIKLDENLLTRLASLLESMGHLVDTVADEGLTGKPDNDVWIAPSKRKADSLLLKTSISRVRANFSPALIRVCCWYDCANRMRMRCYSK